MVVSKEKLSYIMGNPPFVGYTYQTKSQKEDLSKVTICTGKNIDYVSGWYFKASSYISNSSIKVAFVSTNSICQGEQVSAIWKPLLNAFSIHFDFAYRTFRWDSEASLKAHVHCVIIGFSSVNNTDKKTIIDNEHIISASNINAYLLDAPMIFIEKRNSPLCAVSVMTKGSQPTDNGHLIFNEEEYNSFIKKYPGAKGYIKPYWGAEEFLKNKKRYCLWLPGVSSKTIKTNPEIYNRIQMVKTYREKSKKVATQKAAETPMLFTEIRQPSTNYIVVPEVSSEKRRYIPMGFLSPDIICSNKLQLIPNASLYEFGILESNVHMCWTRTVCGRLETRYDYSGNIVYNNFPWPTPTPDQKARIEQTAQGILDARALYPDSSLADLYDPLTMPPELRKAHDRNNAAVMKAYGFPTSMSEAECVAALMKMYQKLTEEK